MVSGTQLVSCVIRGEHVDPELLAGHRGFEMICGFDVLGRQRRAVPVQPHAARGSVEVLGDQRGEEVQRRRVHRSEFVVAAAEIRPG
jgi:hypothetical protein